MQPKYEFESPMYCVEDSSTISRASVSLETPKSESTIEVEVREEDLINFDNNDDKSEQSLR